MDLSAPAMPYNPEVMFRDSLTYPKLEGWMTDAKIFLATEKGTLAKRPGKREDY